MQKRTFNLNLIFLFSIFLYTNLNNFSFAQMPPQQYVPSSFPQYSFPQAPSYNFPAPSTFSFPGQPSPQVQGSFAIPQNFQQPQFIPSYSPPDSANTFIAPPLAPTQQQATQPQALPQQAIQPEPPSQPQAPPQQAIQPEPPTQPQAPDLPQNASNVAKQVLVKIFDPAVCNATTCTGCNSELITSRIGSPLDNCLRAKQGNTTHN